MVKRADPVLRVLLLALPLLPLVGLLGACTPPASDDEELHDEDLQQKTDWDDIISDRGAELAPIAALELEEIVLTPERLAALPDGVRQDSELARLAVTRFLGEPALYAGGVYGRLGNAKVFLATQTKVPDDAHLYWVMVRMLSEKFSCFMVGRQKLGIKTRITCRDGRQVMFWRGQGPGWIGFHARQFDEEGYEIAVRRHQIVRLSSDRVLQAVPGR